MSVRDWLGDPDAAPLGYDGRACTTCGRRLTERDSLLLHICRACSGHAHCDCDQMDRPHNVYVLWRGVRLGFETQERAERYVRIHREAHHPSVYCGPPVEEPVIEVPVTEPVLVER